MLPVASHKTQPVVFPPLHRGHFQVTRTSIKTPRFKPEDFLT